MGPLSEFITLVLQEEQSKQVYIVRQDLPDDKFKVLSIHGTSDSAWNEIEKLNRKGIAAAVSHPIPSDHPFLKKIPDSIPRAGFGAADAFDRAVTRIGTAAKRSIRRHRPMHRTKRSPVAPS